MPLLRLTVGRNGTAYYELLIACQIHARNLTGLSAAGSPRGIPEVHHHLFFNQVEVGFLGESDGAGGEG